MVTKGWAKERGGKLVCNEYSFNWGRWKFCMNVGDVCIIRMYLMSLNYAHATLAMVSFMGFVLYPNKNFKCFN